MPEQQLMVSATLCGQGCGAEPPRLMAVETSSPCLGSGEAAGLGRLLAVAASFLASFGPLFQLLATACVTTVQKVVSMLGPRPLNVCDAQCMMFVLF